MCQLQENGQSLQGRKAWSYANLTRLWKPKRIIVLVSVELRFAN
jgi:hypothetical protein